MGSSRGGSRRRGFGPDHVGFAWTAAQDTNFTNPYVRGVILNKATLDDPKDLILWNRSFAYAYPAVVANRRGQLGVAVAYGGGRLFPSFAVGLLQPPPPPGRRSGDGPSRASVGA